jgi:SAM-dependent methyltransferase
MGLNANLLANLRAFLADPGERTDEEILSVSLRSLAKWRSQILANTVASLYGRDILNGPFKGMAYLDKAAEGPLLPRMIGSYESELHPHLLAFAEEGLDHVVDVGCAEGYYAVGLARLMPSVQVHAFDIDPAARKACAELAALNGVADRVRVGEAFAGEDFAGEDFARFENTRTLVFMDIEGGEQELLDPDRWPALRTLKIVVETHPGPTFALTKTLTERFAPTHTVVRLDQGPKDTPLPPWFATLSHLDQLLATWEWRLYPTPWLVMRPKTPSSE